MPITQNASESAPYFKTVGLNDLEMYQFNINITGLYCKEE